MLITGVFWGTWFTLTRSIESFSSEEFVHIGKVIIANVAVPEYNNAFRDINDTIVAGVL